ncbi:recombinase RecF [Croceibacterium mercuriale]|uniref:Recombinase RecF n=1 Tax=Croceibacterium mercuriale TaxID=1572751 RepID=A0A0B2C318_9SPHN|nr:PspC domain-containing protein [Croceibacterium mercuriale]KHL26401.1 recombinase RecF [Croceibacterium mercuriale]
MSALEPHGHGAGLRLDKANGKLMGVCAGLANRFEVDPLWIRLLFVIGTLVGFGSFILIYLAIALLVK